MENYINLKEDKNFFPYEYGVSSYDAMHKPFFDLLKREELGPNIDLICKEMLDNGVVFSSPGGSFERKFLVFFSQYMNYRIRTSNHTSALKSADKLRQLMEPLAKILCTEKSNLEEFKKKIPNGYGEYDFSDGTRYKGEWKDGQYHGQGIFYGSRKYDYYKGNWKNGRRHGKGISTYFDGIQKRTLKGEFRDNRLHGQGSEKTENYEYFGNWKNGNLHGQGTFKNHIGDKYKGEWKEGKKHGKGIQNFQDGRMYIGSFKDNKRWHGKQYDNNGKIDVIFDSGVEK